MDILSTLDCNSWASVKKIVTCAYCLGLFKKPCTLICCHSFCYSCIESIKVCPTCQQNELLNFKLGLLHFENYFLARLTKVFINQQNVNQSCTECKSTTKVCKRCFIIGCTKCNSQTKCIDDSKQHLSYSVDLNDSPEKLLHLFAATGYCEQHENGKITSYCYTCDSMKCSECLQLCISHKTSTLKNPNESLKLISSLDGIKKKITDQGSNFVLHKEKLDDLFKKDFEEVAQWFEHACNCLYHEKQNTLFRLQVFQISINKKIERFQSDLSALDKMANDFQTYFTLLLDKSSDHEKYLYKKNTLEITYRVSVFEDAIKKVANQFENNLDSKKVFQKFFTQTRTCEGITKCDTKCKRVENLRSHLNIKQKYKYEVISYFQALNNHDKLEADQITMKGNWYSMYSLPHASSELVKCSKKPLADISKCASCVSQLKLYNKTITAQQDAKVELKDKGNIIYERVISSINMLLGISINSIQNIEKGIMFLHDSSILMYFKEIQKNFTELESFAKITSDFQKLLDRFVSELQSFQTYHMNQPPNMIYSNMLLDIIIDCQMYATSVHRIVTNICHTKTIIELLHNENGEYTSDKMISCISEEGFQVEIVSYYSTCVALNKICEYLVELINNWTKQC